MKYPASVLLLSLSFFGCALDSEAEEAVSTDRAALSEVADGPIANTIPPCPVGTWCLETPPVAGVLLRGASAVSASDVFVVGDDGTILRRTGGNWITMTSGTTADLHGVWALGSSNVWAAGVGGVILHFNGTAWSSVSSGVTSDLEAIWASGANDVWIVGGGSVLHWNGTAVSTAASFAGTMLSVSGTSTSDVWVVGENTSAHHWNGSAWSSVVPLAGLTTYFAVLALGASDVWITDFMPNKEALHFASGKWTPFKTTSGIFTSLSALSSSDIWGAGSTKVGHWNGTAWTTSAPLGSLVSLSSVTTTTGHVWVVGSNSTIGHLPL